MSAEEYQVDIHQEFLHDISKMRPIKGTEAPPNNVEVVIFENIVKQREDMVLQSLGRGIPLVPLSREEVVKSVWGERKDKKQKIEYRTIVQRQEADILIKKIGVQLLSKLVGKYYPTTEEKVFDLAEKLRCDVDVLRLVLKDLGINIKRIL